MTTVYKLDSNFTGLRYAQEESIKKLPVNPVWRQLEPNSYSDFGGQISTVARNPINDSRQDQKGTSTGITASGGFQQDLTLVNSTDLLQGFFFADAREKATMASLVSGSKVISGVDADSYAAASGFGGWKVGSLVLAEGFSVPGNNGIKTVAASSPTDLGVVEALSVEASPPLAATVQTVGFRFPTGDVSLTLNGELVQLTASITDMSTLGVVPGEWIFIGGDEADHRFNNGKNGFARISRITPQFWELDKAQWLAEDTVVAAEAGTGKSINVFFGIMIKNELKNLIKRRTYTFERSLGEDADGEMAEYLMGAVPNELTINMPSQDKVTLDMSFIALDNVDRSGAEGLLGGTRVDLPYGADCFNTSIDFSRINLSVIDDSTAAIKPVAAFIENLTLSITNGAQPNKALGQFGGFDVNVGNFSVKASANTYFNGVRAAKAVRDNTSCTLDFAMVKDNKGILFDLPLLTLGNSRKQIAADAPIMLPLDQMGARSKFNNTLTFMQFPYLPVLASGAG